MIDPQHRAASATTGWGGLARYVTSTTLAAPPMGAAVVAIMLLVTVTGGCGWLADALGACITAPPLLGPFVARRWTPLGTVTVSSRQPVCAMAPPSADGPRESSRARR